MRSIFRKMACILVSAILILPLLIYIKLINKKRNVLIWGPVPILNNKYWSAAMNMAGYNSITYMSECYSINKKEDFDKYFFYSGKLGHLMNALHISNYLAFCYCVRNCSVIHIPYTGGFLGGTPLERIEAKLLHLADIKIVVLPYGSDFYRYSRILDKSLTAGLLNSYPEHAKCELAIARRVEYWNRNADFVGCGYQLDGAGRWDMLAFSFVVVDTDKIFYSQKESFNNGLNGTVRIVHTPNHRGVKGTEFLIQAVEDLKDEGLDIELVLLEHKTNDKVLEELRNSDILAEQFILTGYGLSGIEGMATGIPVLSNLENEEYTRVFRRYSYLNECPILSTSPENIKENLRILIKHPELRKQLGIAGRKYVEKYHSYMAAKYIFSNVYEKILNGKNIDLMNVFHPLKSDYVKNNKIIHPLKENTLPKDYSGDEC